MKNTLENEVLTIFFEGEINSFNSEDVDREIDAIMNSNQYKEIVIDMRDLRYISSAGLRILIKVKKECAETKLVNVPKAVYDVFGMVGFENLFKIEKLVM